MQGEGRLSKVWIPGEEGNWPLVFDKRFERETFQQADRIAVTTDGSVLELLLDLVRQGGAEFVCTYTKRDAQDARFRSRSMSFDQVAEFVARFRTLLETDPSQNFSVENATTKRHVLVDEHNVVYVSGDISDVEAWLAMRGFHQGQITLPTPHVHIDLDFGDLERDLIRSLTE